MTDTNRTPYNQLPDEWAFHPEKGPFWRDILDQLRQLRDRTGGDQDTVTNITIRESYPWPQEAIDYEEGQEIAALYSGIPQDIPNFRAVTVTSAYTALPFDFINAKLSAKIKFPAQPEENSVIIIRNGDGTTISLDGNGKNINGEKTGRLLRKGTAIHFHYFIDTDEWFAR